ncbi:glycosyltransferase family 2 protein [Allorhodopirellula solitaria]|uniref:Putative glycosyltransferase EpsJ n=1 Tax=Allorhodopirellula solitaria TaxID=2527987 RepID=A0A5C5X085_9BACT|nr:glycosyltransferase family 2 protein [Allorhodopirellula solitaria]TWT56356.1 putative glycosyltransferase EpsJ [Allorhodopirellula solitaria]
MQPLPFSIVITNFNKARLIDACLRSALQQTVDRSQFEVVVVDDCSTDDSLQILSGYEPDIRVITNSVNRGALGATLAGVDASRGTYVVTLDGDDTIAENLLQTLVDSSLLRPDRFMRGRIDQSHDRPRKSTLIPAVGDPVCLTPAWHLALEPKTGGSSLVFPRDAVADLCGRFPPIAVQDHAIPEMLSLVMNDYLRLSCYTHFADTGDCVEHLSGNSAQLHHDKLLCGLAILENATELKPVPTLITGLRRRLMGRCLRYVWKYQLWGSVPACRKLLGSPSLEQLRSVAHRVAQEMRSRHASIRYYASETPSNQHANAA